MDPGGVGVCYDKVLQIPCVSAFLDSTVPEQETVFFVTFIRGSGGGRRDTVTESRGWARARVLR